MPLFLSIKLQWARQVAGQTCKFKGTYISTYIQMSE